MVKRARPYQPVIEEWKMAVGWPHYEISNLGRMRSLPHKSCDGRQWCGRVSSPEGRYVNLRRVRGRKYRCVNFGRLMLLTFRGEPPKEKGFACHKDDNVSNHELTNLYWGSKSDNGKDAIRNGCLIISGRHHKRKSIMPFQEDRQIPGQDGTRRKAHYGSGRQPWDDMVDLGWAPDFAAASILKYLRRAKDREHSLESAKWYYNQLYSYSAKEVEGRANNELVPGPWTTTLGELETVLTNEEMKVLRA